MEKQIKKRIAGLLDLSEFSDSQQNKIISGLLDNISARVNIAAYDKLTEEDRQKLQKISKIGDADAILNFLKAKIKNLSLLTEEITIDTVEEFKNLRKN